MTYVNKGEYADAINAYKESLKIKPHEAVVWFHLGTTYSKAEQLDNAIVSLKKGLEIDPSIVKAWMDLREVYLKKGEKDLANEALRKAVATGKVDFMFAGPNDSVEDTMSKVKKWEEKNK